MSAPFKIKKAEDGAVNAEDNDAATGHFIHMNKLLERSRKSCAKFANDLQHAEKDLRETKVDRDRWRVRALAAEAELASLGVEIWAR